jgi:hypothetical protein
MKPDDTHRENVDIFYSQYWGGTPCSTSTVSFMVTYPDPHGLSQCLGAKIGISKASNSLLTTINPPVPVFSTHNNSPSLHFPGVRIIGLERYQRTCYSVQPTISPCMRSLEAASSRPLPHGVCTRLGSSHSFSSRRVRIWEKKRNALTIISAGFPGVFPPETTASSFLCRIDLVAGQLSILRGMRRTIAVFYAARVLGISCVRVLFGAV